MNCFCNGVNCVTYQYTHRSQPTSNYPQGYVEEGQAIAFKSRNGVEVIHRGNRGCSTPGSGTVYRKESYVTHPDGDQTFYREDNRGTAIAGNVENNNGGRNMTITSMGKVGNYSPGRHNVVTNVTRDSAGNITATDAVNGQTLSTTNYKPVKQCSPSDITSAINEYYGQSCSVGAGNVIDSGIESGFGWILWVIIIIIIIIIIVAIFAWAARGASRGMGAASMGGSNMGGNDYSCADYSMSKPSC